MLIQKGDLCLRPLPFGKTEETKQWDSIYVSGMVKDKSFQSGLQIIFKH